MPPPTRQASDEYWASVGDPAIAPKLKRLAGTIATLGLILGIAAIVGLLFSLHGGVVRRTISLQMPPSVYACSLSFFAIGFGAVAFWAVKQIPGQARVRALAVASLLVGLAGPPIFSWQTVQFHIQLQTTEVDRARALINAALAFEKENHHYPANLLELLQSAHLGPDAIKTAFGSESKLTEIPTLTPHDDGYAAALHDVEKQSDFLYLAGNITKPIPAAQATKIIIIRSKSPHLESQSAAVGFADGTARWIRLDDAQQLYDNDTAARTAIGAATRPTSSTEPDH